MSSADHTPLRRWAWLTAGVILVLLVVGVLLISIRVEEPLRHRIEQEINQPLEDYSIAIGRLDIHPLSASVTLEDLKVWKDDLPDPALVEVPRLDGRLDWRALLSGKVVVSLRVERPALFVNRAQLREEARDEKPIEEKGWQEAIENVNLLEINQLHVVDGRFTYLEDAGGDPVELEAIDLRVTNIRNIRSESETYPSSLALDARVFDEGYLEVEGDADFLSVPRPTGQIRFSLTGAPLARLAPASRLAGVAIRGGRVTAAGRLESAPDVSTIQIEELVVDGVEVDYVETEAPKTTAKAAAIKATESTTEAVTKSATDSRIEIMIDSFEMRDANIGFVNAAVSPRYRLFLDIDRATLEDFSNRGVGDASPFALDGRFMGSGTLQLRGRIQPDEDGPDLGLELEMKDVEIETLNELLRAHGGLDVVSGRLSVFSEVKLQDRKIDGYVKPLFVDLEVSDPEQDADKPLLSRIYEGSVGAVARLLENDPLEQVATVTPIEGEIDAIDIDGWRSFVLLLRNGFVEAIREGLEGGNAVPPPDA